MGHDVRPHTTGREYHEAALVCSSCAFCTDADCLRCRLDVATGKSSRFPVFSIRKWSSDSSSHFYQLPAFLITKNLPKNRCWVLEKR